VKETTVKFPRIRSFVLRQPSSQETVLYYRQALKELEGLVNALLYARMSRVTPFLFMHRQEVKESSPTVMTL
jgi:hypothetical protein